MTDTHTISAGDGRCDADSSAPSSGESRPATVPPQRDGGAHPTKAVLRALEIALCGQAVPHSLDSSEDRQRIVEIQRNQLDAGWRQLRSRYPTVIMAARELHIATERATRMVDELLAPHEHVRPAYAPARLALVSTIARRLIIDGIAIARGTVDSSRVAIGQTGSGVFNDASLPAPEDATTTAVPVAAGGC